MSNQFNWQVEEELQEPEPPKMAGKRWVRGILSLVILVAVAGGLLGRWVVARERAEEEKGQLIDSVQEVLDLQQTALLSGDGERYFSLQENDPAAFATHLLPRNQAIVAAGLRVTNAEENGQTVWANALWNGAPGSDEGETLQKVLFFQPRAGQLRHVANDPRYWGAALEREEDWGRLSYHASDDPWATPIANYVNVVVSDVCAEECLGDRLPFTLDVRDDFRETAAPDRIHIPSPRLLGLDAAGKPALSFWQELDGRIRAHITPATIRFAVPPPRLREGETLLPYEQLAEQFMALYPAINVEIVHLEAMPDDPFALAREYDGAAILPSEQLLASGLVRDLTDYMSSDPEFEAANFYEQIWQGTFWKERNWFVPIAAEMKVIYYDKRAYEWAEHAQPSSRWTWAEMAHDVANIVAEQPQQSALSWGFLDVGLDSLFSYAYNWNNSCSETATVFCQTPLEMEHVAAALEWYQGMAVQPGQMPDLTGDLRDVFSSAQMSMLEEVETPIDEEGMALLLLNLQGSQRKAAIWVDTPMSYEFNLLLSPVGVLSFPGSDRFDGITPLWLHGGFISQESERPTAVWQWLAFLSRQAPATRFIPARPSVAAETGFWSRLPRQLGDVMRTAFPFARPVTIGERGMLTWDQVAAVLRDEISAEEAANSRPEIRWFEQQR